MRLFLRDIWEPGMYNVQYDFEIGVVLWLEIDMNI